MFGALGITVRDAAVGFVSGMVAATVVAVLFVLFRTVEQTFMPVAMLLRSVPLVVMTPLITLIFGRELLGVAVIGGIVVFFPALVNIAFGLRSASPQATDLIMAYGGTRMTVLRKVAVPTAMPSVFASARISVPASIIGALIAEWLATGEGIGAEILRAIGGFRYDEVWADIVVVTGGVDRGVRGGRRRRVAGPRPLLRPSARVMSLARVMRTRPRSCVRGEARPGPPEGERLGVRWDTGSGWGR
ncbi:ABC transporter permease [Nonomuraea salmonea]|uniref:ABC transporter permease n=1 Tax=Nonomuraea salmonea TaxID=46181 RepID=UPI002FE8ED60